MAQSVNAATTNSSKVRPGLSIDTSHTRLPSHHSRAEIASPATRQVLGESLFPLIVDAVRERPPDPTMPVRIDELAGKVTTLLLQSLSEQELRAAIAQPKSRLKLCIDQAVMELKSTRNGTRPSSAPPDMTFGRSLFAFQAQDYNRIFNGNDDGLASPTSTGSDSRSASPPASESVATINTQTLAATTTAVPGEVAGQVQQSPHQSPQASQRQFQGESGVPQIRVHSPERPQYQQQHQQQHQQPVDQPHTMTPALQQYQQLTQQHTQHQQQFLHAHQQAMHNGLLPPATQLQQDQNLSGMFSAMTMSPNGPMPISGGLVPPMTAGMLSPGYLSPNAVSPNAGPQIGDMSHIPGVTLAPPPVVGTAGSLSPQFGAYSLLNQPMQPPPMMYPPQPQYTPQMFMPYGAPSQARGYGQAPLPQHNHHHGGGQPQSGFGHRAPPHHHHQNGFMPPPPHHMQQRGPPQYHGAQRGMPPQQQHHAHHHQFGPPRMDPAQQARLQASRAAAAQGAQYAAKLAANPTVDELRHKVYVLAKDQHGCRLLQRMLDDKNPAVFDVIYVEVFTHINELQTDPFGNYLCQKLLDYASDSERLAMVQAVSRDLVAISLNIHGTRVVQKMLEVMSTHEEVATVRQALQSSVVTLTKDLNGNHVIQRCLHHMPPDHNQFIFDSIATHCVSVATHKHGCCVLQRCIDYATVPQRSQICAEILRQNNLLELIQDAFGNYVVQYILDLNDAATTRALVQCLLDSQAIANLAVQKFSSNVIEKLLELTDNDQRVAIVRELCQSDRLPRLLQDPYANYVIQKSLSVVPAEEFDNLVHIVRPHVLNLRNTSFGKRIQSKIIKKFPILGIEPEQ